jgi:hypothetical protein
MENEHAQPCGRLLFASDDLPLFDMLCSVTPEVGDDPQP